jgi:hypothetical protein
MTERPLLLYIFHFRESDPFQNDNKIPVECIPTLFFSMAVRFSEDWAFRLVEASSGEIPVFDDAKWRKLDLPHDCSIEQPYDPAMAGGSSFGYLPGGIGTPFSNSTLPTKQLSKGGRKMEKWRI